MIIILLRNYLYNLMVVLSCTLHALIGGDPYETMSSVLGKAQRGDFGRRWRSVTWAPVRVIDAVMWMFGLDDHCQASIDDTRGSLSVWRRRDVV